ncbi:hypothetical protein [Rickettsiella endosymbiont of Dermanyssus gallinae]|uniref:hypothetical protein n=1 Tax=Rickettsiella endosymbiont of Dermanyssus gallinae TaxID=2856608 RepID=UPI001C52BB88|nr:hypothetical protein [Rickettsiella endosymbiont of Dermanyssus gallinae]
MDPDISLHDEPNIQELTLSLFKKSNHSAEEYKLIKKSLQQIKEITDLRSKLIRLGYAEVKELDTLEKGFIVSLHRILDHKIITGIYLHSQSLARLIFRTNIFFALTIIATILAIVISQPIIQPVAILLTSVIASTLILLQLNAILLKDDSPFLSEIRKEIILSIIQLKNLLRNSNKCIDSINKAINRDKSVSSKSNISFGSTAPAEKEEIDLEEMDLEESISSKSNTSFGSTSSLGEEEEKKKINPDGSLRPKSSPQYFKNLLPTEDRILSSSLPVTIPRPYPSPAPSPINY